MPRRDVLDISRESGSRSEATTVRNRTTEKEALRQPVSMEYYSPSYKTLNYTTWKTDVSARVGFYETLGQMGSSYAQKIKKTQDSINLAETYNELNENLRNKSREFKNSSESGEGYLDYISDAHAKLSEKYLSGVFDPEYSGQLKTMLLKSKADWENTAFEEEQSMRTAYTLRQSENAINGICVGMVTNPGNFESGMDAIENALEGYRSVAGEQAYTKVRDESRKNFTYCYGLGLVQKNPYGFSELMGSEKIKALSPEQVNHLRALASSEIKKREAFNEREAKRIELLKMQQDEINMIDSIKKMVASGTDSVTDTDIEQLGLSENQTSSLKEAKVELKKKELVGLEKLSRMTDSLREGYGVGGFGKADQLKFLELMVPKKESGETSVKDWLTMGAKLNITATNYQLTNRLLGTALRSDNAELVAKSVEDYKFARNINSKLIGQISDDEEFILEYAAQGGESPELILRARNEAKDIIEKIRGNPGRKTELREYANEYFSTQNSSNYKELQNKAWENIEDRYNLEKRYGFFWASTYEQYQKINNHFNTYYKARMRKYLERGLDPASAARVIVSQFESQYGKTELIDTKEDPNASLMYRPPEQTSPGLDDSKLKKIFSSFARNIDTDKKYLGYKITVKASDPGEQYKQPIITYDNGTSGGKGTSKLQFEWNDAAEAYDVFFTTKEGGRIYLVDDDFRLKQLNFNKYKLGREESMEESKGQVEVKEKQTGRPRLAKRGLRKKKRSWE